MNAAPEIEAPVGTIGMLFTDIAGSTALAARIGARWGEVLSEHHRLLETAIAENGGYVDGTEGDAFFATFADPPSAVQAAVDAQRALHAHRWPEPVGELKVRMGVHVGRVERQHTGYVGLEVHRAARVAAAAHGGQLLLTRPAVLAGADIVAVDDLGPHRLKDFPAPAPLYCARIDGRGAHAFPPLKTLDARPTNLPAGPPPLVGREQELAEVAERLGAARLVSLTGRGGAGKTSLALVAAIAALDRFPGGVWWVELAATAGPADLLPAIAATIVLDAAPNDQMIDAIGQRLGGGGPVLLVLDNMEHLLDAAPDLAALLRRVPSLRALVTTQAPLRLPEETVIALDALEADAALALCETAARRAGRSRPFTTEEREDLLAVCASVDFLPLAIELAASRLTLLSPAQLRQRLERSLDIIKGDRRHADRHRSLSRTLDWSLDFLSPDARAVFVRMGAFAGPVELEEIEAVAGDGEVDVLEAVTELLEASLLTRVETGDGRLRLGMPQALRRLARARLDADPASARWRRAHARRQLERCLPGLNVHCETVAEVAQADDAEPEARLAIERVSESDPELAQALRIAIGARHAHCGRLADARSAIAPLAVADVADPTFRAGLLFARGQLAGHSGDPDEAVAAVEAALELAGDADPRFRIALMTMRGFWLLGRGDVPAAVEAMRLATATARAFGGVALATALMMESMARQHAGDLDQAELLLDEGITVGERLGASVVVFSGDSGIGDMALGRGDHRGALMPYLRSIERAELRNDIQQIAFDLSSLAACANALGYPREAVRMLTLLEVVCEARGTTLAQLLPFSVGLEAARTAAEQLAPEELDVIAREVAAVPPAQRVTVARQVGLAVVAEVGQEPA